uniref:Uncharacterized protein n=1 Tax=viral metagenome TaxID=1070528 RepID=A0A6M3J6V0_9ZZZZ
MSEFINKHSIKIQIGVLCTAIIFLIMTVWSLAEMKSHVITYESKWAVDMEEKIEELERAGQARDLVLVEVRTKLTSIEAILQEIRVDLKKMSEY